MAIPLIDKGYEVHCIANRIPAYADRYRSLMIFQTQDQLFKAIKLHENTDVFHCHNEPSWFVTAVKSIRPRAKTVLDAHDSMLIRVAPEDETQDRISIDERNNFQLADGMVFASQAMADICRKEYGLDQPHAVVPSYVPEEFYRLDSWKWIGGIVYEGRVDFPDEIKEGKELPFFSYAEYTGLAKALHEKTIPFYLYTPRNKDVQETYGDTAIWKGSYEYGKLIRQIGRHQFGLVGNLDEHLAWKHAMPNKLFEYLAAGLPVIAINADSAGAFIEEHGFGMNVKTVDEIVDRWTEHRKCRANVAKHRLDWSMERHIDKVEKVYKELV